MKRKICIVTGSRADYGHLAPLIKKIHSDPAFDLRLVVLSISFPGKRSTLAGLVGRDGLRVAKELAVSLSGDSAAQIARCAGDITGRFGDWLERGQPELVVLLGDRYEILACAQAALFAKVPVAHIGGGDTTEGAFDESIRHSVSKMAHLHFVTHEAAGSRLRQMGENPRNVFNVGSLALDQIRQTKSLDRATLERRLGLRFRAKNLLITFHPSTLSRKSASHEFEELLEALESLGDTCGLIFTDPNVDPEAWGLARRLRSFSKGRAHVRVYPTLGSLLYFSVLSQVDAVVGNSSSGLYEVPSFLKPTVNIGARQQGRILASSVISCDAERGAIERAIRAALKMDCSTAVNPYGDGRAAERIVIALKRVRDPQQLLQKHFFGWQELGAAAQRTLIIAEAGVNHNGSLSMAKKLVDAAVQAGADIVKFQTFRADLVVSKSAPKAAYQKKLTGSGSQWEMIRALELNNDEHGALYEYAKKRGIEFLSAPFDEPSVDLLAGRLKLKRLKIPSGEITNAPLLLKVARTGLPVILSTGMSELWEIEDALGVLSFGYTRGRSSKPSSAAFREAYASTSGSEALHRRVTLLQCTTEYPAPFDEANLRAMDVLKARFQLPVGLSDHTTGFAVPIAAVAHGAVMIEKHLTLDRHLPGPDHYASLEPSDFKRMVVSIRQTEAALGRPEKRPTPSELKNRPIARKSLVAARRIRRGEVFSENNLTTKRPGTGLSPSNYWLALGKKAPRAFDKDELIHFASERP